MPEKVKLVIWDLDDTFWRGTLTEGGHVYERKHHDIVVTLAARGIISTICSKNDFATVQAELQREGTWDYFVFPSVNWEPKGQRIAQLIEDMQLRAPNVLFIDDNPANRNEALFFSPELQVADETYILSLLDNPLLKGKDDRSLTRLNQYKLLQRRKVDERLAGSDNIAFLRSSEVRVIIEPDVTNYIDRAVELVNRTNQLNFTKLRLPEDVEAARTELQSELRRYNVQAGLVRVQDRYGDHGYVGFYLMEMFGQTSRLIHFCFSCRILNMGVETWLFHQLGKPQLKVVGEVLTDINAACDCPDWINAKTASAAGTNDRSLRVSQILAHGGCNIAGLSHYFSVTGAEVVSEFNVARNGLDTLVNHSVFLRYAMEGVSAEQQQELVALGYVPSDWTSALLGPQANAPVWLLSFWADADAMLYRHRTVGIDVPFNLHFPNRPANLLDIDPDRLPNQVATPWLVGALNHLKSHYDQIGRIEEAPFVDTVKRLLARAPRDARIFILLNNELQTDLKGTQTVMPWKVRANDWTRSAAASFPNVELLDVAKFVQHKSEIAQDPNHLDRLVYYRIFQHIVSSLETGESRRAVAAE